MTPTPNKYRNSLNVRYLKALFRETTTTPTIPPLYTLSDRDYENVPSLYRLYMELDDLTEYEFANTYLDGWEHWQMLCQCSWFQPYAARWRQEIELRTKARALRALKLEAEDGKNSYQANKVLLDGGWKEKKNSRGRPSKEEVSKLAAVEAERKSKVNEDFERVFQTNAKTATPGSETGDGDNQDAQGD